MVFGVGDRPIYFLLAFAAVWPILLNTAAGVRALAQALTGKSHTIDAAFIINARAFDMSIDLTHFTPLSALIGGSLIGVAEAALVLVNGRIAGVSGIVGGLLQFKSGNTGWRAAFAAGLVTAPLLYQLFSPLPPIRIDAAWPTLVLAGVLVGVGTRYGSGCTSGHAVCGLSRLSLRSLLATLTFMGTGFVTVFLLRHVLGG